MKDARNLNNHDLANALEEYESNNKQTEFIAYHDMGLLKAAAGAIRRLENLRVIQREALEMQRHRIDQLENEVNAVEWMNGKMERELDQALRR